MFFDTDHLKKAIPVSLEDLVVLGVSERCVSDFVDEFDQLYGFWPDRGDPRLI